MLKLLLAFAVFAAVSLYVIFKAGDKADMSGEKHGIDSHPPAASAPAEPAASAASK